MTADEQNAIQWQKHEEQYSLQWIDISTFCRRKMKYSSFQRTIELQRTIPLAGTRLEKLIQNQKKYRKGHLNR